MTAAQQLHKKTVPFSENAHHIFVHLLVCMHAEAVPGKVRSWGLPGPFSHRLLTPGSPGEISLPEDDTWLARGNGRSYGDVCLNSGHTLLHTRWLDRYIDFDPDTGTLTCESGVLLSSIVEDFGPRGWFLPVVPGTRYVTVGGAIANDVHGKNHHAVGSFGDHVQEFRLLRTDGTALDCSRQRNPEWFNATIGGLGLTGVIARAQLRLRRIQSGWMRVHAERFVGLNAFFGLNAEAEARHEYTVSWIDCLSGPEKLRGVLLAGDHVAESAGHGFPAPPRRVSFPVTPPFSLVNPLTLRLFNSAYYHKTPKRAKYLQPVWRYFWPLDTIEHWNRMYGRRGLLQYQFVVPPAAARNAISEVLGILKKEGAGSFLAVLKTFGDRAPPGLLSFPRAGLTLALDFPNTSHVRALFARLDDCIAAAGGALYPAKDAVGSSALFHTAYPRWAEFQRFRDPAISSTFARRMEGAA